MKKKPITKSQKAIYDWIKDYIDQNGISPSYHEIAAGASISNVNAWRYVQLLCSAGWLEKEPRKKYSIRISP